MKSVVFFIKTWGERWLLSNKKNSQTCHFRMFSTNILGFETYQEKKAKHLFSPHCCPLFSDIMQLEDISVCCMISENSGPECLQIYISEHCIEDFHNLYHISKILSFNMFFKYFSYVLNVLYIWHCRSHCACCNRVRSFVSTTSCFTALFKQCLSQELWTKYLLPSPFF